MAKHTLILLIINIFVSNVILAQIDRYIFTKPNSQDSFYIQEHLEEYSRVHRSFVVNQASNQLIDTTLNIGIIWYDTLGNKVSYDDPQITRQISVLETAFTPQKSDISDFNHQALFRITSLEQIFSEFNGIKIDIHQIILPDSIIGTIQWKVGDEQAGQIFINHKYFGQNNGNGEYKQGKTLVMMLGQYFGLQPLLRDGDCQDDGVRDTPIPMHLALLAYQKILLGPIADKNSINVATT